MDRTDLETAEAKVVVAELNHLIRQLYARGLHMTSWYGTLPTREKLRFAKEALLWAAGKLSGRNRPRPRWGVGMPNRGPDYEPLPGSADDGRIPWYLYWEIFWVMTRGPRLQPGTRLLDAGGTSSLFSCYLASLGYDVHSVDINRKLVANADRIARCMGWKMFSYTMDMRKLEFADGYFDHAYSISVFEHLDYDLKQTALCEIARCLKPGGILSVTFDYRSPAVPIWGFGPDSDARNQIRNAEDIRRNFLSTGRFELVGNQEFHDDGKSYLVHPDPAYAPGPYTFGAVFLRKKA